MSLFRHVDGRIMKRTPAGGTGGGATSHFDELATAEEIAGSEFAEPAPTEEPEHHEDGEIRPSEAEPNA